MYIAYITQPEISAMQHSSNPMARTQIYLSAAQQAALGRLAQQRQVPKSELIRQALDEWLAVQQRAGASKLELLRQAQGIWQDRADMDDSAAYVRKLREDGERQTVLQERWEQTP